MTTPTKGAVTFTCLGRGPHMFGAQSAELAAIHDELGEVPLVGFTSVHILRPDILGLALSFVARLPGCPGHHEA